MVRPLLKYQIILFTTITLHGKFQTLKHRKLTRLAFNIFIFILIQRFYSNLIKRK